jgi:hypothetical protein
MEKHRAGHALLIPGKQKNYIEKIVMIMSNMI